MISAKHNQSMREQVEQVLAQIRPFLRLEGGDVQLVGLDESRGVVKLRLRGACAGCPMALTGTLRMIEFRLRQQIPQIRSVELA